MKTEIDTTHEYYAQKLLDQEKYYQKLSGQKKVRAGGNNRKKSKGRKS